MDNVDERVRERSLDSATEETANDAQPQRRRRLSRRARSILLSAVAVLALVVVVGWLFLRGDSPQFRIWFFVRSAPYVEWREGRSLPFWYRYTVLASGAHRWLVQEQMDTERWLLNSDSPRLDRYLATSLREQSGKGEFRNTVITYAGLRICRQYRPELFQAYVEYFNSLAESSDMTEYFGAVLSLTFVAKMERPHPYDWERVKAILPSRIADGGLDEVGICYSKALLARLGHKEYIGMLLEDGASGNVAAMAALRNLRLVPSSTILGGIRFPDASTIPGLPTAGVERAAAICKAWSEWWRDNSHRWHWDPEKRKYVEQPDERDAER